MLETDEIIAAAQARTPLIKQGDTLSKDAYFYMGTHVKMVCRKALLLHTSTKCADSLIPFSGFYVKYKCDMCHAETVKVVSKVKMMKIHGSYDCWWNLHCSIRERESLPHISYLQLIQETVDECLSPDDDYSTCCLCNSCYRMIREEARLRYEKFISDPLPWVNTHKQEGEEWQWGLIDSMIPYPEDYPGIPDGHLYCGVKLKYCHSTYNCYDKEYLLWKKQKEKDTALQQTNKPHTAPAGNTNSEPTGITLKDVSRIEVSDFDLNDGCLHPLIKALLIMLAVLVGLLLLFGLAKGVVEPSVVVE